MKAYAQKQSKSRQQLSHGGKRSSAKPAAASHAVHQIVNLQRTIGNRAVRRLLAAHMVNSRGDSVPTNMTRVGHGQGKERIDAAPASVDHALASPGRPLAPALQQDMEQRFGYDFSRVRVHSDKPAEQSARDVNAHAYTVGSDIVFGAGQFSPETQVGRRMIAHELAHVVQQSSGASGLVQRFEPPAEVTLVPVQQKPYSRIGEVMTDLRHVVQMLSYKPPSYDTAKLIVQSVYKSVDNWLGDLLTTNRLEKVFGTMWNGAFRICWDARNAIGAMYGVLDRAQYDAQLRGETNPRPSLIDVQLAEVEFAVPYIEKLENAVSYELEGAEALPDVPTKFTKLSRSEAHVLAWLQKYQADIASAASKFKVDRRAVAGAIAWEAIVQVKRSSWRAVGPGKAHVWEFSGTSAVDEVEERGYMPEADDDRQKQVMKTVPGSTEYIAAIMGSFADTSTRYGLEIRNDPGVLTTIYHGWRPSEWEERMKNKAKAQPQGAPWPRPIVANPMGIWVDEHLPYLEEAVGFTPAEQQAIGEKPHGATGEGKTAPVP